MKKIALLSILVIAIIGCSKPPRISNQDNYFENYLFSIDYPKNWVYRRIKKKPIYSQEFYGIKVSEFEFKDQYYPKYYIRVGVIEKEEDIFDDPFVELSLNENAERFLNFIIKSYTAKNFSVYQNFGNLSDMIFNGIDAKLISLKVKDKQGKISFDSISIYFIYGKRQYYIVYVFYPNYDIITKSRIESVVYSLKPKEFLKE